jgi:hypothetical protein
MGGGRDPREEARVGRDEPAIEIDRERELVS